MINDQGNKRMKHLEIFEAPLSAGNTRMAALTGRMLRARTVFSPPLSVQLWVRNATIDDRQPSDELQFECRETHDGLRFEHWVAIRTEAEMFADLGGRAGEDRWIRLDGIYETIERWEPIVPLADSRRLLLSFLELVHAESMA